MPISGSSPNKTFSRSDSTRTGTTVWQQSAAASRGIQPTDQDYHDNDIATAINTCWFRDGGNQPSADLPLGGYKFTGVGNAAARTSFASAAQVQDGSLTYAGTAGGTANALTLTLSPAITAYVAGQGFSFLASATSSAAATVNVSAVGVKTIKKASVSGALADLEVGDIRNGFAHVIRYDGTYFQLLNPAGIMIAGRSENDTTEREFFRATSGSGVGDTYSRRLLGSGSNAVATIRDYIGTTQISNDTTTSRGLILPIDFTDTTTPSAPGSGFVRVYSKSGALYSRSGASGAETPISQRALAAAQGVGIVNNTGTPNTQIDVTASQAILTTSAGVPFFWSGGTVTIDLTVAGAVNRLDTGTKANSTWYYVYLISDGTTTGALASVSSTSPTLPSGYIYFMRVGAMQTDGSGNLRRTKQMGRRVALTSSPQSVSATATITASTYFPPTAAVWRMYVTQGGNNNSSLTDSNNITYAASVGNIAREVDSTIEMLAVGTTILYTLAGSGSVTFIGWEDGVNVLS